MEIREIEKRMALMLCVYMRFSTSFSTFSFDVDKKSVLCLLICVHRCLRKYLLFILIEINVQLVRISR